MSAIHLHPLRGLNPLGLFAALGTLDVAQRLIPDREPRLSWTDDIDPHAILHGPENFDTLLDLCTEDLDRWRSSRALSGPHANGSTGLVDDVKVSPPDVERWFAAVAADSSSEDEADLRLLSSLVCPGAVAKDKARALAKPTHFHFTAGQQHFLAMARTLRDALDTSHFHEALHGPWRDESELPVFGWDAKGERIYALSGPAPSKVKKLGTPGADWLALLGLRFFPVSVRLVRGEPQLQTTGCHGSWKRGSFTWPLWERPLDASVVASLVAHDGLRTMSARERGSLGVHRLATAPIRRSEQGGYGSFGVPTVE